MRIAVIGTLLVAISAEAAPPRTPDASFRALLATEEIGGHAAGEEGEPSDDAIAFVVLSRAPDATEQFRKLWRASRNPFRLHPAIFAAVGLRSRDPLAYQEVRTRLLKSPDFVVETRDRTRVLTVAQAIELIESGKLEEQLTGEKIRALVFTVRALTPRVASSETASLAGTHFAATLKNISPRAITIDQWYWTAHRIVRNGKEVARPLARPDLLSHEGPNGAVHLTPGQSVELVLKGSRIALDKAPAPGRYQITFVYDATDSPLKVADFDRGPTESNVATFELY